MYYNLLNGGEEMSITQKLKLFFQFRKSFLFIISFMKSKEVSKFKKMFFIGLTVAYLLSPIDLIPELVFGPLGLTDDVAAVAFLINWMFSVAPRSLQEQYNLK